MIQRKNNTMKDLTVPFAIRQSDNVQVHPSDGETGVGYSCPSPTCKTEVRWKKGFVRSGNINVRSHFFHVADPTNHCEFAHEGESEEHCSTKLAIRDAVNHGETVKLVTTCTTCKQRTEIGLFPAPGVVSATCEHSIVLDGQRYRLDVALLDEKGQVVIGVEVCHLHPVGEPKASALTKGLRAWVEVPAGADLATLPVLRSYKPLYCPHCKLATKPHPWVGQGEVVCPHTGQPRGHWTCKRCKDFVFVTKSGVWCYGSRMGFAQQNG